jgi:3-isopropylmalate/(R)-2-methylmalate dehydratase large subunit
MAETLAEKIIARAANRKKVCPGEIVTCNVDLAMMHDSGGPRRIKPILERLHAKVWDADKVVLVSDHYAPAVDAESAAILSLTRKWAVENGIKNFYDQEGICHVILPERGHLLPGMFVVGGDSHSPTGGAFGCFMFGVGATDMASILITGKTWIKVPNTIRIEITGTPGDDSVIADGVSAKDIILYLCSRLGVGGAEYQVIEYAGDIISHLSISERMTLTNMTAELGAQTGLIAADETTFNYIRQTGRKQERQVRVDNNSALQSDDDAYFSATHKVNVAELVPYVAMPDSPDNAVTIEKVSGVQIQQAYIGACTGAKLEDLQMAARVLKNNTVAKGIRLLIAPASIQTTAAAAADGTLKILTESGAILMPSGCGACAGYGAGILAEGEVCISSTARNFKGRMGHPTSKVYLGSPYTVAASAIVGHITDPRKFLNGDRK